MSASARVIGALALVAVRRGGEPEPLDLRSTSARGCWRRPEPYLHEPPSP